MKLSSIVGYLNQLNTLDLTSAVKLRAQLDEISYVIQNSPVQFPELADELLATQDQVKLYLQQHNQRLDNIRQAVQQLIRQHEPAYFDRSTRLYESIQYQTSQQILQRIRPRDSIAKNHLHDRLRTGSDCRWPGLVIGPALSAWVEDLVALDPMYFVDVRRDLIDPAVVVYPPEYQRRIRCYVIDDRDGPIFQQLPQNQFGLVYGFDYFNFRPLEIVKQYIQEVFDLLRPGGKMFFNFNDCDQSGGVSLVEQNYCCYTPTTLIHEHVKQVGFEIVHRGSIDNTTSWLELQKPGQLTSIRGGQTLAKVVKKPGPVLFDSTVTEQIVPDTVDIPIKKLYNSLDLDQLIGLAGILAVDITNATTKGLFNIKKVRRTIEAFLAQQNLSEDQLRKLFKRTQK